MRCSLFVWKDELSSHALASELVLLLASVLIPEKKSLLFNAQRHYIKVFNHYTSVPKYPLTGIRHNSLQAVEVSCYWWVSEARDSRCVETFFLLVNRQKLYREKMSKGYVCYTREPKAGNSGSLVWAWVEYWNFPIGSQVNPRSVINSTLAGVLFCYSWQIVLAVWT